MSRIHLVGRFIAGVQLLCCALVVTVATARADELTGMANASFALTVLDMATTRLSIAHTNGTESNPIARPFVRSDVGALGYAVLTTAVERIVFRRHPRAFAGVVSVEAYAAVHNYMSRLRALNATHAAELTRDQR